MYQADGPVPLPRRARADLAGHVTRPAEPVHLFALRIIRLMAIGGIDDARAAAMLIGQFGRAYRRPLVLMRAMMLELARVSRRRILLAPSCCGRITRDEALMIAALSHGEAAFVACHRDAAALLGHDEVLGAATCFQAVGRCFADLGAPLGDAAASASA